ncbi:MAG: hypothetical protein AAGK78_05575, partial [Planctomycetota bacterium]
MFLLDRHREFAHAIGNRARFDENLLRVRPRVLHAHATPVAQASVNTRPGVVARMARFDRVDTPNRAMDPSSTAQPESARDTVPVDTNDDAQKPARLYRATGGIDRIVRTYFLVVFKNVIGWLCILA